MVLGSPKQRNLLPGVSRQQAMTYAAEVLRAAMPAMEKNGVILAIGPLGPADTNFILTAAEGVELMKMVNSPHCRLHLDCKAMATEPTPIPELIRKYRASSCISTPMIRTARARVSASWILCRSSRPCARSATVVGFPSRSSTTSPGGERLARESIRYLRQCAGKLGP